MPGGRCLAPCRDIGRGRLSHTCRPAQPSFTTSRPGAHGDLLLGRHVGIAAGGPAVFATVATDPESDPPWTDEVSIAADRLVEIAEGLAGGADQVNLSRS